MADRTNIRAGVDGALKTALDGRRAYAKFQLLGIAAQVGIDRQAAHERCVEDLAALIRTRGRRTDYGTFWPFEAQGAWYSEDGAFVAPMHTDGSFDPDEIGEVTVPYEEA